jgi:hypothetical protein
VAGGGEDVAVGTIDSTRGNVVDSESEQAAEGACVGSVGRDGSVRSSVIDGRLGGLHVLERMSSAMARTSLRDCRTRTSGDGDHITGSVGR